MILNLVCLLLSALTGLLLVSRPLGNAFARHFRNGPRLRLCFVIAAVLLTVVNAVAVLSPSAAVVHELCVIVTLLAAFVGASVLVPARIQPPRDARHRVVLAIGAHPDDLELACGGTLAKLIDQGHEVHAVVMSQGTRGGNSAERPSEARRAGAFLGLTRLSVLDYPDTELPSRNRDMVASIEDELLRVNPDIVLTHSASDQHQDHFAVHQATLRAARHHPSILCYESPSTTRAFNPSIFIDIAQYINIKVKAVEAHTGQTGKPYMKSKHVRGIASFRGAQAKREYAEAFEAVRLLGAGFGGL